MRTAYFLITFVVIFSLFTNLLVIAEKNSPLKFLKHLEGCHKGDNVEGILELKKLLQMLGYLDYKLSKNKSHENDNIFDEFLETAVKTYQTNFHLRASGVLERKTIAAMEKPRCGVADVVSGKNWMDSTKKKNRNHQFHSVQHYSFFEGNYKWPPTKTHLTYAFLRGIRRDAIAPVSRAFATWQANTHFKFSKVEDLTKADIKISFERGDHGDGDPFDGPAYRLIAHAFAPTDGRLHFDVDNLWGVGAVQNKFDIETVALHEIGHLLGLYHSNDERAIMWPTINDGSTKGLSKDDIEGIKALYQV